MTDKLKVGVIGCGGMAHYHIRGYLSCGRYEVVALADLSAGAMEDYDRLFDEYDDYHPSHYTDGRDMLASEDLDVVSVGVWHRGHAEWTIAAAAHKPKAVLCEKPMADTVGRADEMLVVCRRNGVKLAIGHQRRFLPSYIMARELLAEGAIGEVRLITAITGDGLLNSASHLMDMFRYLLSDDDCEWVMGSVERSTDRYERATRIEDRAVAALGFKGGAQAMLLSDLVPDHYQGGVVYGSEGMIELFTGYLRVLNAGTGGQWERHDPDGKFFKADEEGFQVLEGSAAQADELADWIDGKIETHRGEATHGYKAVEMASAVYESARLHERVVLPLKTRDYPLDEMIDSGHLPVRHPGRYDIRARLLRGENMTSDVENI